jgi:ATP-dependent helicase HrpA
VVKFSSVEQPKNTIPPDRAAAIHRALLAGLISNVGHRREQQAYEGVGGRTFRIFPGSTLFRKGPGWVMAAEMVQTSQLYARTVAAVQPGWIERAAEHLIRRTYSEPHWQQETGFVAAFEKVLLRGLTLVPRRLVHYGPIDPRLSRELFIRHALVEGEYRSDAAFFVHNRRLVEHVRELQERARRHDLLADPALRFDFFEQRIPASVYSRPTFEAWRAEAEQKNPMLLFLSPELVQTPAAAAITPDHYPDRLRLGEVELALSYRYQVHDAADGITVTVPLPMLGQLPAHRFDWLVPGYLIEKLTELIRTLPKHLRVQFIPAGEFAAKAAAALPYGDGSVVEALAVFLGKSAGIEVHPGAMQPETLPDHLYMRFRVVDAAGKTLSAGRDLAEIRAQLRQEVWGWFAEVSNTPFHRDGITRWEFGDLPIRVEVARMGMKLDAFPALVDRGETAALRLLDSPASADRALRAGARRLFMTQVRNELQRLARTLPGMEHMLVISATFTRGTEFTEDLLSAIADRALFGNSGETIRTQAAFVEKAEMGWRNLPVAATEVAELARTILDAYHAAHAALSHEFPPSARPAALDMRDQLGHLIFPGFLAATAFARLRELPRYLQGIAIRRRKLMNAGVAADARAMGEVQPLWDAYKERALEHRRQEIFDPALDEVRWMIEELRVSLFAQELKTPMRISATRIRKQWELVQPGR